MFRYFTEALLTFFYQLYFLCRFLPHIDKSVSVSICSLEYEYGSRQYKSTKPLLYTKKYVITVRNEVAKVMFSQACVCPQGGSDLVPGRGGGFLFQGGVCSAGGVCSGGVCSAGGVCSGGCLLCTEAAPRQRRLLLRTIRILLECILVFIYTWSYVWQEHWKIQTSTHCISLTINRFSTHNEKEKWWRPISW